MTILAADAIYTRLEIFSSLQSLLESVPTEFVVEGDSIDFREAFSLTRSGVNIVTRSLCYWKWK